MAYPPHTPDLLPSEFSLFPKIKYKLRVIRFTTADETVKAFRRDKGRKAFFRKFVLTDAKCIDCEG